MVSIARTSDYTMLTLVPSRNVNESLSLHHCVELTCRPSSIPLVDVVDCTLIAPYSYWHTVTHDLPSLPSLFLESRHTGHPGQAIEAAARERVRIEQRRRRCPVHPRQGLGAERRGYQERQLGRDELDDGQCDYGHEGQGPARYIILCLIRRNESQERVVVPRGGIIL